MITKLSRQQYPTPSPLRGKTGLSRLLLYMDVLMPRVQDALERPAYQGIYPSLDGRMGVKWRLLNFVINHQ